MHELNPDVFRLLVLELYDTSFQDFRLGTASRAADS